MAKVLVTSDCDTGDTQVVPNVTVSDTGAIITVRVGASAEEGGGMPFLAPSSYAANWTWVNDRCAFPQVEVESAPAPAPGEGCGDGPSSGEGAACADAPTGVEYADPVGEPAATLPGAADPGARQIDVDDWVLPYEGAKRLEAAVGDTVVFDWVGGHNVYLHPTLSCDAEGARLVGARPGAAYTFAEGDGSPEGTDMFFACDVGDGSHCRAGESRGVPSPDAWAERFGDSTVRVPPRDSRIALRRRRLRRAIPHRDSVRSTGHFRRPFGVQGRWRGRCPRWDVRRPPLLPIDGGDLRWRLRRGRPVRGDSRGVHPAIRPRVRVRRSHVLERMHGACGRHQRFIGGRMWIQLYRGNGRLHECPSGDITERDRPNVPGRARHRHGRGNYLDRVNNSANEHLERGNAKVRRGCIIGCNCTSGRGRRSRRFFSKYYSS